MMLFRLGWTSDGPTRNSPDMASPPGVDCADYSPPDPLFSLLSFRSEKPLHNLRRASGLPRLSSATSRHERNAPRRSYEVGENGSRYFGGMDLRDATCSGRRECGGSTVQA